MREASERTDDEFEKPSETLDDFRERVVENHGPDGLSEKEQKEEATDSWTRGESPENKHQPGVEIDGGPEQPRQVDLNNPEPSQEAVGQEAKEPIEERAKEDGNPAERISEKGEERSVGEQGKPWAHDGQELPSRIDDQALEGKEAGSDPPPSERGTLAEQPETDVLATVGPSRPSVEQAKPSPTEDIREDGLAAAEIESRTRSENQITVTVQEQPERRDKTSAEPELDTPALRSLPYDSTASGYKVEEPRVLEAVNYGKGAVLRVPKTDLEKAGFEPEAGENAIVEVKLRNQEAGELETVFVRYVGPDRRAEAYVGDVGGQKGSRYELVEAREYSEERFIRDFERGRCEHLQNVRLENADGRMFVNIDNRRVEMADYRLSTSGSHVILRGKLYGEDRCKIEYDGRRASVRFGRDYPWRR